MDNAKVYSHLPGLLYCVAVAVMSFFTWSLYRPVSPLMWAFIYSIILANALNIPERLLPGIGFSSSSLLRGTIAALGLVTSAAIWLQVGVGVVNALVVVFFSLILGIWLGKRLGLSTRLATLIGVGTSICGASAIAALAPAIKARDEEVGLALAGITLFGLLSMFLYPFLFVNTIVNQWLGQSTNVYAIWVGSGVHETAQVIASAGALGPEVVAPAMLIKSIRIFMIGPVVLLSTYVFRRLDAEAAGKSRIVLPMFGVIFILNSFVSALLDAYAPASGGAFDWIHVKGFLSGNVFPFLLATAFAGVGSRVRLNSIARLGVKPFSFAALIAVLAGILSLIMAIIVSPIVLSA